MFDFPMTPLIWYINSSWTKSILVGENWQIWRIMSYSPKFSLPTFTDTPKMYLAYALIVAYLPKFSCQ